MNPEEVLRALRQHFDIIIGNVQIKFDELEVRFDL